MKDRHWTQISDLLSTEFHPEMEKFNLENFIDMKLMDHVGDISNIGDRSGKEFQIEKQLANMKKDWEPIEFDCKEL